MLGIIVNHFLNDNMELLDLAKKNHSLKIRLLKEAEIAKYKFVTSDNYSLKFNRTNKIIQKDCFDKECKRIGAKICDLINRANHSCYTQICTPNIILTGGLMRVPVIQNFIIDRFKNHRILISEHPESDSILGTVEMLRYLDDGEDLWISSPNLGDYMKSDFLYKKNSVCNYEIN